MYFLINGKQIDNQNQDQNIINLNKIGVRSVDKTIKISIDITLKITVKIFLKSQERKYQKREYSTQINYQEPSAPLSFYDRIKFFSGGNNNNYNNNNKNTNMNSEDRPAVRESRTFYRHRKIEPLDYQINKNENNLHHLESAKITPTIDINNENKKNVDINKNIQINQNKNEKKEEKIEKKASQKYLKRNFTITEQNEKNEETQENENEEDSGEKEYFIEGITYDKYLSKLKSENKKEEESGRESFCEGFFIASFPQKNGQVIENSQSFPSACGHKECSILPAMKPEIFVRYPLKDTKTLELNNLAATICFPTGIKVCYSEETPSMIKDYVTTITNQKGERYYMMTYHFYHKIENEIYTKLYEMHPLKHHLMKFGDDYLNMNDEELNEKLQIQIQENLEISQNLGFRDYIYIPYCICLISKYPYVTEMKKCLQSIYLLLINHLTINKPDLNRLIMYLIHSVPIPERNTKVKFFIPYCDKGIELICPKVQDISIMNTNISSLLKYFSIDKLVIIFRLILFEKKILFIDDDYTRLSFVTDSFIKLLYPFQWVHTYIPIMSDQMLKYLETFLPFLNGINSSLMNLVTQVFMNNENEDSEEVFIIYITKDKFRLGSSLTSNNKKKYKYLQDNVPALPTTMEKELKYKLKKIKDELEYLLKNQKDKKIDLSEIDFRIRNVFIEMFVQMFHDYYKYMTFIDDDVVFNKKLFLEKITNNYDKHFYEEFIDTQLFQQFTQNIVKDELNYFTTMAMQYDPNKKDILKRALGSKQNKDKLYVIKPSYLDINIENSQLIEKAIKTKYIVNQDIDEDGIIKSSDRIIYEIDKIKDELYSNQKCYIYTLPESLILKNKQSDTPEESQTSTKESNILKTIKSLKLQSTKSLKQKDGLSEKEKDNIKEMIKDFTIKIFKSEEIEESGNLKKDLLNVINGTFGRNFFVNILSKNVTNIILLKEKSFQLLGTLIYNSLLFILNIEETDKLIEESVILVRSTKYFGQEIKGATETLWDVYKGRIQTYSKTMQPNFWNKWYELDIKKEVELNDIKKEKIILDICDIMISLELTKSFVKNVTHGLSKKEFGDESEQNKTTIGLITQKIIHTKYISKAK